jgi:succinyl-CoA synthetase alpha subunit
MSILVDASTRLVVQGITGREGAFHATRNLAYGTQVVAGVTPGKGGQSVEDIPVFDTLDDAVEATGANAAMVFVPPRFAADALYEAVASNVKLIVCITEGIPAHDVMRVFTELRRGEQVLVGPNCPGVISPGVATVGIMPTKVFQPGRVGLISRSGTLTYQISKELSDMGIGQSTVVGIGGDPVVGSSFIDMLALFEADDDTDLVVMVGEIGGAEEEKAAEYISASMKTPVISYIAGFQAPAGKQMGHAGAIITGSSGTAEAKRVALEANGVRVGTSPTEAAQLVREALGS